MLYNILYNIIISVLDERGAEPVLGILEKKKNSSSLPGTEPYPTRSVVTTVTSN
jgi:hypothetical protein